MHACVFTDTWSTHFTTLSSRWQKASVCPNISAVVILFFYAFCKNVNSCLSILCNKAKAFACCLILNDNLFHLPSESQLTLLYNNTIHVSFFFNSYKTEKCFCSLRYFRDKSTVRMSPCIFLLDINKIMYLLFGLF